MSHISIYTVLIFLILSCDAVRASVPEVEHTYAIFQDDFEDWDADNWNMLIPPDASYGTSWDVLDDEGNNVLSLKGTMIAGAGDPDWTDYTLMVRVKLVDVRDEARICVRMGDEGQRYFVGIFERDLTFTKQRREFSNEVKVELMLSNDTWHVFKIVCLEGEFWVYVDDELQIEYVDEDDPMLSGGIGFECGPRSNAYFDDVRVTVTHGEYVKQLIEETEDKINEAKMLEVDTGEAERLLEEAKAKLAEGDIGMAESLSRDAAAKAIASMTEEAPPATQEQPRGDQQPPATQSGNALSIESVATLITIGGAVVGVVGWMFKTRGERRRRAILFKELMTGVDDIYERFKTDAPRCEAELRKIKERVITEFKQNLITEENYKALDSRIEEYLRRAGNETGSRSPKGAGHSSRESHSR